MEKLRGLWQQIPSTTVSEILCMTDLDFICLDTEHGVFNEETIFQCIQTISLSQKKVFIRVTEANKTSVRHYLDAGVDGLIFSTVDVATQFNSYSNNIQESFVNGNSEKCVSFAPVSEHLDNVLCGLHYDLKPDYIRDVMEQCKFPDIYSYTEHKGKRGYGLTRDNLWGETSRKQDPILIAQIETVNAVNNIYEISNSFDYCLVGPYDLSSDLGCPGDFDNPEYVGLINQLKNAVDSNKLGYHIVKDIEKQYLDLKECGILAFSLDTLMLIDGIKSINDTINSVEALEKIK